MAHSQDNEVLSMPLAIIVAGALIGFGIYMGAREIGISSNSITRTTTQAQNAQPQAAVNQQKPSGPIKITPVSSSDHIRGSLSSKVIIVEYSDTECPFCKRFDGTLKQVVAKYGNQIAWVYRHSPLPMHSKAMKEAEATECAAEQGGNTAFWRYVDRIFEISPLNNGLDPKELPNIAEYIGLDRAKFETCLASGKFVSKIQAHIKDMASAGGSGTPFSVLVTPSGNSAIKGAYSFEQIETMIKTGLGIK